LEEKKFWSFEKRENVVFGDFLASKDAGNGIKQARWLKRVGFYRSGTVFIAGMTLKKAAGKFG